MSELPIANLEETLGYVFTHKTLLVHALTHSSRKTTLQFSNERLEFLGDAVLGMIVSDHLYRTCPDFTEGDLTRAKSRVVSRESLVRIAEQLGLAEFLDVAKGVARPTQGEASDARPHHLPRSLLSDAIEAIIAAVYIDSDTPTTRALVLRLTESEIVRACRNVHVQNFKSALQQFTQRTMGKTPVYRVIAEEGADHVKSFEVVTVVGGVDYAAGRGKTKKEAEQLAAKGTLEMLARDETTDDVQGAESGAPY